MQESILVIPRIAIIADPSEAWHGIKNIDAHLCMNLIQANQQYHPRAIMETDRAFKQIIPYLVYLFDGNLFVMQRRQQATEQRLAGKLTIGIGGHMRQEDMQGKSIIAWAERELQEEVAIADPYNIELLGMLNDDTNDVGYLHLGLVLLLHGSSDRIAVRSELKSGRLMSLPECFAEFSAFETWSQLVLQQLAAKNR